MEIIPGEILRASLVLFAVIDIVGSIPVILSIKKQASDIQPLKASLVSLGIMIAFLFVGLKIIGIFGIGINEFAVAGSLVLFALALEMILGIQLFKMDPKQSKTASIVPIAFPMIAGAGSITSILSLKAAYSEINILIAIVLNVIIVYVVLRLTDKIEKVLGDGGVAILQKVFGIILLAIAVKLFSENVQALVVD